MRLLITGGFGYLGGRLAQALASQVDNEVILGSRRTMPPPSWLPHAKVVKTLWESRVALDEICSGVDAIVHLAGMNAQASASDPVAALKFNALNTARLLRAAVRQRVRRFIYCSTVHVYGRHLIGVISEKSCPTSLHPYATSHRAAEDVVRSALEGGEIEGIVIRLSNAYGEPAHKNVNSWTLLVNDLCRQAASKRFMVLRSTGLERRDFISLTEFCYAVEHLLRLSTTFLETGVFNVGGEWTPTVWEMACLVQARCVAALGFFPELSRIAPRPEEVPLELNYRLDGLRRSGFQPHSDRFLEIERLLLFCKKSFG